MVREKYGVRLAPEQRNPSWSQNRFLMARTHAEASLFGTRMRGITFLSGAPLLGNPLPVHQSIQAQFGFVCL